ncbi:hypothetical protein C4J81_00770 [Deltaproteobacteria bacterium Smac51]|nr:hypothetical protein C4J81_00770 [Deltaproteobacteria bacterium Smac51]
MSMTKKTIMLVDDNLTNLQIGSSILMEHYNVITMNSGQRLLKTLERKIPDLILLDIEMPEMNGYETIRHLKENDKFSQIPVIFLTAKNDDGSEHLGLSLGAVDYVTKPFSVPLLLKRLEVHLLVEDQKKIIMEQKQELDRLMAN